MRILPHLNNLTLIQEWSSSLMILHQVLTNRRLHWRLRTLMSRLLIRVHSRRICRMPLCSIHRTRSHSHLIEKASSIHASINHLFSIMMLSKEGVNIKFMPTYRKARYHTNQTVNRLDSQVKTKIATFPLVIKCSISEKSKKLRSPKHSIQQVASKSHIRACS